jgi:hypothetical protein
MPTRILIGVAMALLAAAAARAQAPATSVQLPTFSMFSVGTTVSVPDRGGAVLGGVNRASSERREFGMPFGKGLPFKNQSIGSNRSAANISVSAYIHDFEAMEEALLGQTGPARPAGPADAALAGKMLLPRGGEAGRSWQLALPASAAAQPAPSLADAQSQRAAAQLSKTDEAADFFARAEQAAADGKTSVAKIYYQMAVRRASGELKDRALARLEMVSGSKPSQVVQSAR